MAEEQAGPETPETPAPGSRPIEDVVAEEAGRQVPGTEAAAGPEAQPEAGAAARLADEYLAQVQRLKADFDNYRRRMAQEQARWSDAAVGGFIEQLLPVVDNLERAVQAGGDGEAIRRGVELTVRQLNELLARIGVEPMSPVGQAFDPTYHEAMLQVETADHPDGRVIEELRKGYLFKRQVLRPAMVKVARHAPPADVAEAADPR